MILKQNHKRFCIYVYYLVQRIIFKNTKSEKGEETRVVLRSQVSIEVTK